MRQAIPRVGLLGGLALLPVSVAAAAEPGVSALNYPEPAWSPYVVGALTGGEFANEWLPPLWQARFGDSIALRAAIGFGGGLLMAFGARMAGGCTSGHGISGTMQLSAGSWIAVSCLFIGGIAVAIPLDSL